MEPKLVQDPPARFLVKRVPHGDSDGIAGELEQAEADGYEFSQLHPASNGDVILIFRREAALAAAPEA